MSRTTSRTEPIKVGTRRSLLATTQAGHVADLIRERLQVEVELVEITTDGDRSQAAGTPLAGSSATGVFVGAVRHALLEGRVDVAVHSLKDLPTESPEGLVIGAIPERAPVGDVLLVRPDAMFGCSISACRKC